MFYLSHLLLLSIRYHETTADFELRSQLGCNLQYLIIVRLERLALEGNDQFQSISCANTKQCTYIENVRSEE